MGEGGTRSWPKLSLGRFALFVVSSQLPLCAMDLDLDLPRELPEGDDANMGSIPRQTTEELSHCVRYVLLFCIFGQSVVVL